MQSGGHAGMTWRKQAENSACGQHLCVWRFHQKCHSDTNTQRQRSEAHALKWARQSTAKPCALELAATDIQQPVNLTLLSVCSVRACIALCSKSVVKRTWFGFLVCCKWNLNRFTTNIDYAIDWMQSGFWKNIVWASAELVIAIQSPFHLFGNGFLYTWHNRNCVLVMRLVANSDIFCVFYRFWKANCYANANYD